MPTKTFDESKIRRNNDGTFANKTTPAAPSSLPDGHCETFWDRQRHNPTAFSPLGDDGDPEAGNAQYPDMNLTTITNHKQTHGNGDSASDSNIARARILTDGDPDGDMDALGTLANELHHDPEYETLETLDAMGDFDTDPMQPWEQQTQQVINQIANGQYVDMENTRRLRNAMEGIADATAGYDDGTPELARSLAAAAALGSNDRTAARRLSEEVLADLRQSPDGKSWQYARTIAEQVHGRL